MFLKSWRARRLVVLALMLASPVYAQSFPPIGGGGTCTGMVNEQGFQGQQSAVNNGLYVCSGGTWVAQPLIIGTTATACSATWEGAIRYVSGGSPPWEYCNGSAWVPFEQAGSACAGPADCPNIGNVCTDGSVFAGCTTPTDTPMFATRCDAGQTYSGSCTGTRITRAWNNGNLSGYTAGTTSLTAGEASTTTLVATDSDSVTAGTQPHLAAAYCDALSIHGKTDWYLPSHAELYLMWVQQSPVGTYTIGNFIAGIFWSSTQVNGDTTSAWAFDFTGGAALLNDRTKDDANYIRCVRR